MVRSTLRMALMALSASFMASLCDPTIETCGAEACDPATQGLVGSQCVRLKQPGDVCFGRERDLCLPDGSGEPHTCRAADVGFTCQPAESLSEVCTDARGCAPVVGTASDGGGITRGNPTFCLPARCALNPESETARRCTAYRGDGQECDSTILDFDAATDCAPCAPDLACVAGRCEPNCAPKTGEACGTAAAPANACPPDDTCSGGFCRERTCAQQGTCANGSPCTANGNCASDVCVGGTCRNPVPSVSGCSAAALAASPCEEDADCSSGRCFQASSTTRYCVAPCAEVAPGFRVPVSGAPPAFSDVCEPDYLLPGDRLCTVWTGTGSLVCAARQCDFLQTYDRCFCDAVGLTSDNPYCGQVEGAAYSCASIPCRSGFDCSALDDCEACSPTEPQCWGPTDRGCP